MSTSKTMEELQPNGSVGIDPGANGGIAYVAGDDAYAEKFAKTPSGMLLQFERFARLEPRIALLERVHAMPGNGVTSMFNFGRSFGWVEMAMTVYFGSEPKTVRPPVWQEHTCGRTKGDKNVSKTYAQKLYPGIKVTHALADALLIATYAEQVS